MPSTVTPFDLIISIPSLAVGVVGLVLSIWFYHKGKILKRIAYYILSDTPVVSIKRQVGKGHIKIEYEDDGGHTEEINDASLLTLKIWNAGNTSIKIWGSDDSDVEAMEEPIEFEFDKRTIVSLTELKTDPPEGVILQKYLDAYLNKPLLSPDHIGLPHCILKPNGSIELAVLLKGGGEKVRARGNIFNGEIRYLYDIAKARNKVESIIFFAVAFVMVFGIIGLLHYGSPIRPVINDYLIVTTIYTLLFWLYMLYRFTHPFECICGYRTHFVPFFKRHVQHIHRYQL